MSSAPDVDLPLFGFVVFWYNKAVFFNLSLGSVGFTRSLDFCEVYRDY